MLRPLLLRQVSVTESSKESLCLKIAVMLVLSKAAVGRAPQPET